MRELLYQKLSDELLQVASSWGPQAPRRPASLKDKRHRRKSTLKVLIKADSKYFLFHCFWYQLEVLRWIWKWAREWLWTCIQRSSSCSGSRSPNGIVQLYYSWVWFRIPFASGFILVCYSHQQVTEASYSHDFFQAQYIAIKSRERIWYVPDHDQQKENLSVLISGPG